MEPSTYPWRTLEAPASGAAGEGPGADGDGSQGAGSEPHAGRHRWALAAAGGLLLAAAGLAYLVAGFTAGAPSAAIIPAASAGDGGGHAATGTAAATDLIVVEVAGAVVRPGVYRLAPGARVADAVTAAGGYAPGVDPARLGELNLAARLEDGQQVRVPLRGEAPAAAPGSAAAQATAGAAVIDLNTATAAELDTLPGVGPATAAKIIASREEQPFRSVDELRGRNLVGASTFAKLRDVVVVR